MLHGVHLFGQELHAEPTFFRALMAVIYASAEEPEPSAEIEPGAAFWLHLVEAIKAEGLIAPSVNADAFTANFVYLLSGATIDWVNNRISVGQWETMVCYGLTLAMLGTATPLIRAELEDTRNPSKETP